MKNSPFSSFDAFRSAFNGGLAELLDGHVELGAYILVMAHAGFDAMLRENLSQPLKKRFEQIAREMRRGKRRELYLDAAEADLQVVRSIIDIDFEGVQPAQFRDIGPWELQFNQMRALRPARMAGEVVEEIRVEFDPEAFHFGAPFLRKEIFWQGRVAGRKASILFNKFPFVPMHSILVPELHNYYPQYLSKGDHDFLWQLGEALADNLPGIGFGYNSYGALASINHLHFQMFYREKPLAVSHPQWRHNGGASDYPIACSRFDSAPDCWRFIDELHRMNCSYNLISLPGRVYCVPRMKQGTYPSPEWSEGFAWYEMAGGFITSCPENFDRISSRDLKRELSRLSIGGLDIARDS
ncbi:MAG: hypothetical protein KDI49_07380 [Gammaproteobacteria bacterium]|nr:hypothetical protein [Gammaproteobacteria bacterium]MCP5427556.1 hypothetical protein [Chromatiaceae bacterium]